MRREFFQQAMSKPTSRRQFLKLVGGAGAGLTLAIHMPTALAAGNNSDPMLATQAFAPNAFVRIGSDNKVTVMVKHVEMGQGTYTGLLTLLADELDADWQQVVAQGAPADASLYNNLNWGPMQGTGGSSAIANSFMQMRTAGATAKGMLVAAAAKKWGVAASEIKVSNGLVTQGVHKATFGELAAAAAKLPVPAGSTITLKTPEQFVFIGKQLSRKDSGKNNGTAIFTQDIKLPGMLTAMVLHPPKFGATLSSVDDTQSKASPGVLDVITIPSGVAVLAKDYWSAKKGRDLLQAQWDESQAYRGSSEQMMADYRELAKKNGLTCPPGWGRSRCLD